MDYILLIIIIAVVLLLVIISFFSSDKKLKIKLENSFGKVPSDHIYTIDSIKSYHDRMNIGGNNKTYIDSTTWNDLDMDKVFNRINACCTSVGEEYLYHLLHVQCFNQQELIEREKLISHFKANEKHRLDIQVILSKLGKRQYNGLSDLLNSKDIKQLKFPLLYKVLALIPLIGIALMPFVISVGLVILILAFVVNISVHYFLKSKIKHDLVALEYFGSMLCCFNKICGNGSIDDEQFKPYIVNLKDSFKVFKPLNSKIPLATRNSSADVDVFAEYIRILILSDIRNYNRVVKSIVNNATDFQKLYCSLGELDASISILSFRESLPLFCTPQFHQDKTVSFCGIYHPLLSAPVVNDADINNNCIITGSNASGKSTFIKAVAINSILAQTIHTCSAQKYKTGFSLVMTSMAVRDNISEGESYFITEIKSLKRILDKIDEARCLCFIDEILKGTNTIERIASSAAILKYLADKNCLCVIASHDIELTEILETKYDNYHFSEQITDDGIQFDYLLKQGESKTRNAVKLLHFMDFDDAIVNDAETLVQGFVQNHKWIGYSNFT